MEHLRKLLPALTSKEKYIGFAYLVFQFALLPTLLQLVAMVFSLDYNGTLVNVLYFTINFICCIAIFGSLLKNTLRTALANREKLFFSTAVGFGIYRASVIALGLLIALLFPDFSNLNDSALVDILGKYPVLIVISTVILAPITEELLYRGLVFGWLQEKNVYLAYILSTLIFASIHVLQYVPQYGIGFALVALVQYLPAGLVFAWAYQHSGTIAAPILIHAANNFLAILSVR